MRKRSALLLVALSGCAEPQTAVLIEGDEYALQFPAEGVPCVTGTVPVTALVTFEGWFQIDADHSDAVMPLLWRDGFAVWLNTDGRLYVNDGSESPTGISAPAQIDDGAWHHVAVTWDTFEAFIFIDGIRLGSGQLERAGGSPSDVTTLGCWPGVSYMEGLMDEVSLSETIRYSDDFVPSAPVNVDGKTLGVWQFNEGYGTTTLGRLKTEMSLKDTYWRAVNGPAGQGGGSGDTASP